MYRIVKITDRNGNDKIEIMDELRRVHPGLLGEIIDEELLDSKLFLSCLCFYGMMILIKCYVHLVY